MLQAHRIQHNKQASFFSLVDLYRWVSLFCFALGFPWIQGHVQFFVSLPIFNIFTTTGFSLLYIFQKNKNKSSTSTRWNNVENKQINDW
jgi:hypothetical protein